MGFINPDHLGDIMGAEGLTANESWLLTVLACHFPSIRPSYDRLVRMTKLSRATVIRVMNDLLARGVITFDERPGRPNIYRIDFDRLRQGGLNVRPPSERGRRVRREGSHSATPGVSACDPRGLSVRPEVIKQVKKQENPPTPQGGGCVEFDPSNQADPVRPRSGDGQADLAASLLDAFYAEWGRPGLGRHERRTEIARVASLVGRHGEERVRKALGQLPAILAKRWPNCRRLSGAMTYLDEILAAAETAAKRSQAAEDAAQARRAEADRWKLEEARRVRERAEQVRQWEAQPEHVRNAIRAKVSGGMRFTLPEDLLLPLCLAELERAPPTGRESLGGLFETQDAKEAG